jgi:formylglycine-generating enzyme required for sulfatase activity
MISRIALLGPLALALGIAGLSCRSARVREGEADVPLPAVLREAGWKADRQRLALATPDGFQVREMAVFRNSLGMAFARVPDGKFRMGDTLTADEANRRWPGGSAAWCQDAQPRRRVRITRSFLIGAHEVTRGQFARFVKDTGHKTDAERLGGAWMFKDGRWDRQKGLDWRQPGFPAADDHPVVCVSWNDAQAFCQWLSKKEGLTYRLPYEAEWEYAARGGTTTTWFWGEIEAGGQRQANVAGTGEEVLWDRCFQGPDGYTWTAPVGKFLPNGFGLYDVIGNACEWCQDYYDPKAYAAGDAEDPTGPAAGTKRVVRGGAWAYGPLLARAAYRDANLPDRAEAVNGFRVVCAVPEPPPAETNP